MRLEGLESFSNAHAQRPAGPGQTSPIAVGVGLATTQALLLLLTPPQLMDTCPACGIRQSPGGKFCSQCGIRLRCPSCGTPSLGRNYCHECGTDLGD